MKKKLDHNISVKRILCSGVLILNFFLKLNCVF